MRTPGKVRKLAAEQLFEYAVKYLAVRACSVAELRSRLRLKAADVASVEPIIERLRDVGYLNDERFAESYASNRRENQGYGRMRVLADLRARRVAGGLAEKTVSQLFEGTDEQELIAAYIQRRMPTISLGGADEKKIATAYRRLRRAGFSSGPVLTVLRQLASQPDNLDGVSDDEPEDTEA